MSPLVASPVIPIQPPAAPPRLLDQLRQAALERGHLGATAEVYVDWSRRFILFYNKRHPRDLGLTEVGRFLEDVARRSGEPLRAIEGARAALDFLYRDVLRLPVGELPRPQPPRLLDQVRQVLRVRHYSPRTEDCYVLAGAPILREGQFVQGNRS